MSQDYVFEITIYEMILIQIVFFIMGYVIGLEHIRRVEWFSYLWHICMFIFMSIMFKNILYLTNEYIKTLN